MASTHPRNPGRRHFPAGVTTNVSMTFGSTGPRSFVRELMVLGLNSSIVNVSSRPRILDTGDIEECRRNSEDSDRVVSKPPSRMSHEAARALEQEARRRSPSKVKAQTTRATWTVTPDLVPRCCNALSTAQGVQPASRGSPARVSSSWFRVLHPSTRLYVSNVGQRRPQPTWRRKPICFGISRRAPHRDVFGRMPAHVWPVGAGNGAWWWAPSIARSGRLVR